MARDRLEEFRSKVDTGNVQDARVSFKKPKGMQSSIDQAHDDIERMQEYIEKMTLIHLEILSMNTTRSDRLDQIVDDIYQTAKRVQTVLRELKGQINPDDKSARGRMKLAQYEALSKRFSDVMNDFNNEQLRYRDTCKAKIRRQMEIVGQYTTDEKLEEMLEKGNVFVQESSQMEIREAQLVMDEVRARHRDIVKLEESMVEMRNLFTDIANMIESQGKVISRIEDHVCSASDFASDGQAQLAKAQKSQSAARRKKFWCVGILAVVLAILIIVIIVVR